VPQVVGDVRAKLELMLSLLAQVRSSTMLLATAVAASVALHLLQTLSSCFVSAASSSYSIARLPR
jgi:hypothetical protein